MRAPARSAVSQHSAPCATSGILACMRVAVVDIGSNSTRLLVADVDRDGAVRELERRSRVTRLGQGVDASGRLDGEATERVFAVLGEYRERIDALFTTKTTAVLTSAVRDAANGGEFARRVEEDFGLPARTLAGEDSAALQFVAHPLVRGRGPG